MSILSMLTITCIPAIMSSIYGKVVKNSTRPAKNPRISVPIGTLPSKNNDIESIIVENAGKKVENCSRFFLWGSLYFTAFYRKNLASYDEKFFAARYCQL